jgi:uncharacterized protein (TIGR02118 family)
MEATILLATRPANADASWLAQSLVALAQRFGDARVRVLVADAEAQSSGAGVRAAPTPASFDTVVSIERTKARWTTTPTPATSQPDAALRWLAGARGYRASVRGMLARAAPPGAGKRSPGLVFVATTVRAPDLAPDAFDAHWRDHHAPLALRHHVGMSGYEQLAFRGALTARATQLDGLALLHFPSQQAFEQRFYDSDAGRAAILEDAQRFLDLPRCEAALMSEYGVRS